MRKLTIGESVYKYKIGRTNIIIITPGGRKVITDASEVTGRDWDTIERGNWKKTGDGMVRPAHIRDYIDRMGIT